MIIFDERHLAIDFSTKAALLNIPEVERIELISKLPGEYPIFIADVYGRNTFGFRLIFIVPNSIMLGYIIDTLPQPQQMPTLANNIPIIQFPYDKNVAEKKIALLFDLPGFDSQTARCFLDWLITPIVPHRKIAKITTLIADVLLRWNHTHDILKRSRYVSPESGLNKCLLDINLIPSKFGLLKDNNPIISIEGWKTLPNPLAYAKHSSFWHNKSNFSMPLGRVNGNVIASNLLVHATTFDIGPIILNWQNAVYEDACVFIDYAMLELDIISYIMPTLDADLRAEWLPLITYITSDINLPMPEEGTHSLVIWRVIKPLREAIQRIIEAGQKQGKDFSSAFWLSLMSAGLRVLSQPHTTNDNKWIGLVYSAHALDKIILQERTSTMPCYLSSNAFQQSTWLDQVASFDEGCALLIGIGDYSLPFSAIPAAAQDAISMKNKLLDLKYPENKIFCLTNQEAQTTTIREHLKKLVEISNNTPRSTVIVFFSGHGILIENEYYIIPYGVSLDDIGKHAISTSELSDWLTKTGTERRVLFLDACHSGTNISTLVTNLPEKQLEQIVGGGQL